MPSVANGHYRRYGGPLGRSHRAARVVGYRWSWHNCGTLGQSIAHPKSYPVSLSRDAPLLALRYYTIPAYSRGKRQGRFASAVEVTRFYERLSTTLMALMLSWPPAWRQRADGQETAAPWPLAPLIGWSLI